MVYWEGFGGHRSCLIEMLYRYFSGGTEETYKKCSHIISCPVLRFEPSAAQIKVQRLTATPMVGYTVVGASWK
jgi:hypothetical protein